VKAAVAPNAGSKVIKTSKAFTHGWVNGKVLCPLIMQLLESRVDLDGLQTSQVVPQKNLAVALHGSNIYQPLYPVQRSSLG